ncbi:PAS domain S-box protein [Oscillatoria sp. FACHB-1407]|uniref:PAS domain S-box protein n=1 Tax=Oscillatoria sp. FACHB-1407 TaxID=2692847 RepID=UPI001686D9AC|nr:PAS domain S-box protein [Oscillatoria sp. FACHB-1407]MBD2464441.1 PAS domain S-box protein [Oscillatoria sp. FACHB-1407]
MSFPQSLRHTKAQIPLQWVLITPLLLQTVSLIGLLIYLFYGDRRLEFYANQTRTILLPGLILTITTTIGVATALWVTQSILKIAQTSQSLVQGNLREALTEETSIAELKTLTQSLLALQESEQRFQELADTIPQLFFIRSLNPDRYVYINSAYERIWGRSRDELLQNPLAWMETIHPDDRDRVQASLTSQMQGNHVQREYRIIRPDGSVCWISAEVTVIRDDAGNPLRFIGLAADISDRKLAEIALHESEEQLRQIADNIDDIFFIKSLETGKLLYLNPACEELFEHSRELDYQNPELWMDSIHPEDRDRILAKFQRELQGNKFFNDEYRIVRSDGSIRWLWDRSFPIRNQAGKIYRCAGISRDITDRKMAEIALEQSETRYRAIVQDQTELISRFLADTTLLFVNDAYCRYFGIDSEDIIGKSYNPVIYEADQEKVNQLVQSISFTNPTVIIENRVIVNGEIRWTQWVNRGIYDDQGNVVEFQSVGRDITDRKQVEIALAQESLRRKTLFDTSIDGIVVLDQAGNIIEANSSFADMLGYSSEEVTTLNLVDFDAHWEQADLEEKIIESDLCSNTFETRHRRKDGSIYDVEISSNSADWSGQTVQFCICRDISERKRSEAERKQAELTLKSLVEGTASVTGEDFFPVLAQQIAVALDVSHALVSRLEGDRLQALALCADNQNQERVSYLLSGSPCEHCVEQGSYYCPGNVQAEFPNNPQLKLFESESYFGVALQNTNGDVIGVLCIANRTAIASPQRAEALLKIFGARAAAEIERLQAIEAIHQLNTDLEKRIQQRTQDLQAERLRLQLALDAANMGTWSCNLHNGQLNWSDRAQAIFGFVPGTFPGDRETFLSMVHPEDHDRVLQAIIHTFETRTPYNIEYRIHRRDSEMRWIAAWGIFSQDESTAERQLIGVVADISDRKQAERDLQESRNMLALVLDAIPQRVFWKDRQSRFLGCNSAFANDYQLTIEAIVGKTDLELPWGEWAHLYRADDEIIATTRTPKLNYEEPTNNLNGEQIWIRTSKIPLTNSQGKVIGILGCYDDITTLKQAELALQQLNVELEELNVELEELNVDLEQRIRERTLDLQQALEAADAANQAKSLFLTNMSHELRTPLNVILGFTQLLNRDPALSAEQQDCIRIMHRSGNHLLHLINEILDLSKIEAGRITLEHTNTNLFELLHDLQDMFRNRAAVKGLQFNLELKPETPQYLITDSNKLRQVLINLLTNAIKFTYEGFIALRVGLDVREGEIASNELVNPTPSLPPTSYFLQLEVEDTGVGIAPEELDIIFDAFTQAEAGRTSLEGTGLGLTISHKIVSLMGGNLTVNSTPGQGSRFSFSIPVSLGQTSQVSSIAQQQSVVSLASGQPTYRILVVDDQLSNRQLMVKVLTQIGLEVQEATGGVEAIARWQAWHPHLIWMDLRMPGLNGYEATRRIRELESLRASQTSSPNSSATKIIALTAQVSDDDRSLALAAGIDDFVGKPIQIDVIFAKMADHLGISYSYQEIEEQEFELLPPTLQPSSLQVMPPEWITALYRAALNCDEEETSSLIKQIPVEHTTLIRGLNHWLQNYNFEVIINLTQPDTSTT